MMKYWFYMIGFMDLLAVSAVVPLVPQHLKELAISPSVIGFYSSLYGAIQLFSSPVVGHLTDQYGNLHILHICVFIASFAYAVCAFVFNSLSLLALMKCVLGIFKHTQDLCRSSLTDLASSEERTKCIGQYNAISALGFIVGPLLSGILTERFGLSTAVSMCFMFCAVLFVINGLVIRFVVIPRITVTHPENFESSSLSLPATFLNDIQFLNRIKEVDLKAHGHAFLARFLLAFAVLIYRSSFVLGVKKSYPNLSPTELGYLLSFNAFIGFVFGLAISWIFAHHYYSDNEEKLQLHAAFFISTGLVFISSAYNIPILLFGLVVLVIGTSASRACGVTLTVKRCSTSEAGKILGLNSSVIAIARFAAPFVAGVAQEYSYSAPAYIALVMSLLGGLVFYFKVYLVPYISTEDKTK